MGAPVASGTRAGSTSGSSAGIHKDGARSDCSRFSRHLRSHDSHNSADRGGEGRPRRARLPQLRQAAERDLALPARSCAYRSPKRSSASGPSDEQSSREPPRFRTPASRLKGQPPRRRRGGCSVRTAAAPGRLLGRRALTRSASALGVAPKASTRTRVHTKAQLRADRQPRAGSPTTRRASSLARSRFSAAVDRSPLRPCSEQIAGSRHEDGKRGCPPAAHPSR
jgi:hypothetical protein